MPVYESIQNAQNKIIVSDESKNSMIFGYENVINHIKELAHNKSVNIAIDGWYGIDYSSIVNSIEKAVGSINKIDANRLYKSREEIKDYNTEYITDDPGFGRVNKQGILQDIMCDDAIKSLCKELDEAKQKGEITIVYGCGASIKELESSLDYKFYIDNTHQKVQWDMWTGKLMSFGSTEYTKDYNWKEYNYSDYYLLARQKQYMYTVMDYYIEAFEDNDLKLIPRKAYDEMMSTLVKYPVKEVKIFSPGPWGAYRYKDLFSVPGLENNAWNKIAGPELRILIDVGLDEDITMPMLNIMQYGNEFVGDYIDATYPGLFPMDIWLDDGYHKEPQPAERISMPMHIHPSSRYVDDHFDEPLGRYETYYIAEAYEGANTWMGFHDDADLEEWEEKCRESENIEPIDDWKSFIKNWESREGDLYLIPPGTMHGHGGNQMVLEMDTNPSINGTEYSFFEYDFARPSWDDEKKTMTGSNLKMHLDHGFDMEKNRRASWVKDNLLSRPTVIEWTKDYYKEQYKSYPTMPYHVERLHFDKVAKNNTEEKFMHILTLTVGKKVIIKSINNPELCADCEKFQSIIIPAKFGEYEIINNEGGRATVVQQRWKKG